MENNMLLEQYNRYKKIGEKVKALKREADRTIEEFNAQYDINPVILVNIVLKF